MECFELVEKTDTRIAFRSRQDLQKAWQEWEGGKEVILSWKQENKCISQIFCESVISDFKAGKIELLAIESVSK